MDCEVDVVTTDELAAPAPRPPYSVLGTERGDALCLPEWQEGLRAYLAGGASRVKLLVTGAAGFIGSTYVRVRSRRARRRDRRARQAHLRRAAREPDRGRGPIEFVEGAIEDRDAVARAMEGCDAS